MGIFRDTLQENEFHFGMHHIDNCMMWGEELANTFRERDFMVSLADLNIKSEAEDPIEDTKKRITVFWEKEGKPNMPRVDSSIKINGKEHHILIYKEGEELQLTIK